MGYAFLDRSTYFLEELVTDLCCLPFKTEAKELYIVKENVLFKGKKNEPRTHIVRTSSYNLLNCPQ